MNLDTTSSATKQHKLRYKAEIQVKFKCFGGADNGRVVVVVTCVSSVNSGFFDTSLKNLTPALPVLLVTNMRYDKYKYLYHACDKDQGPIKTKHISGTHFMQFRFQGMFSRQNQGPGKRTRQVSLKMEFMVNDFNLVCFTHFLREAPHKIGDHLGTTPKYHPHYHSW